MQSDSDPLPRNARGFTIIELLVVITILVVLAALIFAISRGAMAATHQAECTNNLRNLGAAMGNFIVDNGRYPSVPEPDGDPHWDRALIPYLTANEVYVEGSQNPIMLDSKEGRSVVGVAKYFACKADRMDREDGYYKRSYALCPWTTNLRGNGWFTGPGFGHSFNVGIRPAIVKDPGQAVMMVEWHAGTESIPNYLGGANHGYHGGEGEWEKVHGKTQNVLFADGHVETIPANIPWEVFTEKYHPWRGPVSE